MYCIKCGAKLSENAKFCSKCGVSVTNVNPANVKTTVNIQVPTIKPPVNTQPVPAQPVKQNAFTFISIGITAVLAILFFLPSVVVNGKSFSMFTSIVRMFKMDIVPFFFCAILMCAAEVLLIIAFINMLTKKRSAIGFVIPASGITVFTLFFFWLTDYAITFATTTATPVFMLILAVANVIFYLISRKAGK